ncbi:MAG: aminopeptidase P family protein [Aestuariivita sp.]|nr:aminopeptidase P family protein [Aestuariivita sp.]MCY4201825.1 aminopeptidase P family protein [Aestuariivita sp.]
MTEQSTDPALKPTNSGGCVYQNFDEFSSSQDCEPRLQQLRTLLRQKQLDGFIIPRADVYQGEIVAPGDERLAWISGFSGSAGFAIVLVGSAALFVDGRYRAQAKQQVNEKLFSIVNWPETSLATWLTKHLRVGGRVGFDPWLMPYSKIRQIGDRVTSIPIDLVAVKHNLIDQIWEDQPKRKITLAQPYDVLYAGETHEDKRARLAQDLRDNGFAAAILTAPESVAWLLNIRGSDVPRTPVAHCFAILQASGKVDVFSDPNKFEHLSTHLGDDVALSSSDNFLAAVKTIDGATMLDQDSVPFAIHDACQSPVLIQDPCLLPKACKNDTEIKGAIQSHRRDAVAMIEFLTWIDRQKAGTVTEIDVVQQLEAQRRKDPMLQDIAFDTIAGTGANGAIIHYRVSSLSNTRLQEGHVLVLDSGGQYLDGTTDVTRTIAIGRVTPEKKMAYTRVLKGMIAMSQLRWPAGLTGRDIEAVGRTWLWDGHMDFDHGLGHGVGSFLGVHEGPQGLSRRNQEALKPGMILSNEPGYYRDGEFGVRIENLLVVETAEPPPDGDLHREMFAWRTLTLVPFERRLILTEMLTARERKWINKYYDEIKDTVFDKLSPSAKEWLCTATQPF